MEMPSFIPNIDGYSPYVNVNKKHVSLEFESKGFNENVMKNSSKNLITQRMIGLCHR